MTDPVTRAARRQTLTDRIAEHLTEWGCPPDTAHPRAAGLLLLVEAHGWSLPAVDAPPLRGRGSTDEGRARARAIFEATRRTSRAANPPSSPVDKINHPPGYTDNPPHGTEALRGSQ